MKASLTILLLLAALLTACSQPQELRRDARFFGTRATVVLDPDSTSAQTAMHEVMAELTTLDGILPPATAKPMLRTNVMLDSGDWFSVNPSIYPLVVRAKSYYRRSHGLFNPALLGTLKQLHGHYDKTGLERPVNAKTLATLVKHPPTMDEIQVNGIRMRNPNPKLRLDFGLLIYGYAVDAEIAHLRLLHIHNARISIGPVTRVIGLRNGKAWRVHGTHGHPGVALRDGEAACLVDAGDASLQPDLLDPRTGAAPSQPVTVLVIAGNASDASVGCSVLALAGPRSWKRAAKDLGLDAVSLRTPDGHLLESPAMAARRKQGHADGKNG